MMAITHLITALAVGSAPLLFGMTIDYGHEPLIYLMSVAFGSLIVDIDEPRSAFGRRMVPIAFAINSLFGHRTITHNLIIAVFGIYAGYIYGSSAVFGFFLGVACHVIGDGATGNVKGALFPFSNRFYTLPRQYIFAVGSFKEYVVLGVAFLLLVAEHSMNVKRILF